MLPELGEVDAFGVVLGWLLGLLSPVIVESIRRKYRRKELTKALTAEMHELQFTLAMALFKIRAYLGDLDPQSADLISQTVRGYEGVESEVPDVQALKDPNHVLHAGQRSNVTGRALAIKQYSLPLLAASMHELPICKRSFAQAALQLRHNLDLYNADAALSIQEFDRSFNATKENHPIIEANLQRHYVRLSERAAAMIRAIDTVQ